MGEALARRRWVVDAESERFRAASRDVREQRVVGVHDRPRGRVEVENGSAPALGDVLELPVAVELVAEEVAEADGLGPHPPRDVGESTLVDLEEAEVRALLLQERRGHPGDEVRSGTVVREGHLARQDLGDHRGGRRLAVGCRDERRPEGEAARELPDRAGVDGGEDLSRNRRPAALSGDSGEPSGSAGEGDFEAQAHGGQSTGGLRSPE